MRFRPGRNLILATVLATLCAVGAFYRPETWMLLLAAAAPVAILACRDYRDLCCVFRDVTVTRRQPAVVARGVPFVVELEIGNRGPLALAAELRDVVPPAAVPSFRMYPVQLPCSGRTTVIRCEFQIPIRGQYEFGPVWLRCAGRLRLLEAQWAVDCPAHTKVLPEAYCSSETLRHDERAELLLLDKVSRTRQHGAGTEFEMLSEFRPGDDPRRIDWRSTARSGYPIVRRFQVERHRDVMIVVDCGRLMGSDASRGTKLDRAVDAALMLGRTALTGGDRCGMALFDDRVLGYLPPVSGIRGLRSLADAVYDVQSLWRESDFGRMFATLQMRQTKRSLIVILSDIVDVETSVRFRTSLAMLSRRHVVLFAALQTPLLSEIVHAPVVTVLDGSRKAVAFRVLREREQALHALRRGGVHVLDVDPARLTVPLLNRFIELRQGSLL